MQRLLMTMIVLAAASVGLRADFSYQESSQMTGGSLLNVLKLGGPLTRGAREAQVSTVSVKGNRMVTTRKDSATIIDLDKETITEVNIGKKQYSVVTFAQMKAAMERALADAQKAKGKSASKGKSANAELRFKVSSKATGKTRPVSGLTAKELMVTMEAEITDKDSGQAGAMHIVSDAWMAPVAGYDEVKAFELKMEKMGAIFRPGMEQQALANPDMVQGLAEAAKEMAKVDGVPVQTVTRIGGSLEELQAPAEAAPAEQSKEKQSAAATAVGIAGRLGGFGRRKEEKQESAAEQKPASSMLVEMTTELSQFSTATVEGAKFEPPSGFKEVQSEIAKRAR